MRAQLKRFPSKLPNQVVSLSAPAVVDWVLLQRRTGSSSGNPPPPTALDILRGTAWGGAPAILSGTISAPLPGVPAGAHLTGHFNLKVRHEPLSHANKVLCYCGAVYCVA